MAENIDDKYYAINITKIINYQYFSLKILNHKKKKIQEQFNIIKTKNIRIATYECLVD